MMTKIREKTNNEIMQRSQSVKYEDIYLKSYGTMTEARKGLSDYFRFYNEKRLHQSFDRKTPSMVYFESLAQKQAAA